jgi:hypothetical protein
MTFIQTMEFTTDDKDKMLEVGSRWADDAIMSGTAKRGILAEDRSSPGRYVWTVFFDSAEDAAKNNERPETGTYAEAFGATTTDGIAFREYDIVAIHGD